MTSYIANLATKKGVVNELARGRVQPPVLRRAPATVERHRQGAAAAAPGRRAGSRRALDGGAAIIRCLPPALLSPAMPLSALPRIALDELVALGADAVVLTVNNRMARR